MDHVRSILKHKLQESQAPSIDRINLSELSHRDGKQSLADSEEQNELNDLKRDLSTGNHQVPLEELNRELDLQQETDLHE